MPGNLFSEFFHSFFSLFAENIYIVWIFSPFFVLCAQRPLALFWANVCEFLYICLQFFSLTDWFIGVYSQILIQKANGISGKIWKLWSNQDAVEDLRRTYNNFRKNKLKGSKTYSLVYISKPWILHKNLKEQISGKSSVYEDNL